MANNPFTNVGVGNLVVDSAKATADKNSRAVNVKSYGLIGRKLIGDSKLHDANFAFLTSKLAKLDPKTYEPKYNVTYGKDIDMVDGGGFVDYIQYYTVNWAGIFSQFRNIVGNDANYIPRVNAGLNQQNAIVYTFALAYDLRFVELEKLTTLQLNKSIEEIYRNAIVAGWDLFCQNIAYLGGEAGKKGLFNHDDIVPVNATGLSKAGIIDGTVSDTAIAGLVNGIIQQALANSNMNLAVIPNVFLVPTWFGSALTGRFSNMYTDSLRSYLLKHNLAVDESDGALKIRIESRPALDTLGTAGVGRVVAYRKDPDFVKMEVPYPMQHYITLPNIDKMSYTTAFLGQVSEVMLPYCTSNTDVASPVQYYDFVA